MSNVEIIEYFHNKADDYDAVDQQAYWVLSDMLLWDLLNEKVLKHLPEDFSFLDAGGGTGRWSAKILKAYPHSTGVIRDISPDMLKQAVKKQKNIGENRLVLVNKSIEEMPDVSNDTFDLVFNFHNVIGFLENPKASLEELTRVLKQDGHLVTVAPSQFHMVFFNIFLNNMIGAVETINEEAGRFTNGMPKIRVFRPEQLKSWYKDLGFDSITTHGFPNFIYPGYQETQLFGTSDKAGEILSSPSKIRKIYEIESKFLFSEEIAARGNNLFITGRKTN